MSADFNFNFNVTVDVPQLLDLLAILGGSTIADTLNDLKMGLNQVEMNMADSFADLMNEIRTATQEIKDHKTAADAAEVQEDADAAARDQTNADRIAALEAQIASGTLSAAQKDEARAAIATLRAEAGLPEGGGGGEPPAPAAATTTGTEGGEGRVGGTS